MKKNLKNTVVGLYSGILAFIGQNLFFYLMTILTLEIFSPLIDSIDKPKAWQLTLFRIVLIFMVFVVPIGITTLISRKYYNEKKFDAFWGILIGSLIFYFLFFSGLLFLLPWYQIGGEISL